MMQVARRGMPSIWVGMGHGDGTRRIGHHIHRRLMARMGQINDHTDAVHFVDHFTAKRGETAVMGFKTASAKKGLLIISDLAKANAQLR